MVGGKGKGMSGRLALSGIRRSDQMTLALLRNIRFAMALGLV